MYLGAVLNLGTRLFRVPDTLPYYTGEKKKSWGESTCRRPAHNNTFLRFLFLVHTFFALFESVISQKLSQSYVSLRPGQEFTVLSAIQDITPTFSHRLAFGGWVKAVSLTNITCVRSIVANNINTKFLHSDFTMLEQSRSQNKVSSLQAGEWTYFVWTRLINTSFTRFSVNYDNEYRTYVGFSIEDFFTNRMLSNYDSSATCASINPRSINSPADFLNNSQYFQLVNPDLFVYANLFYALAPNRDDCMKQIRHAAVGPYHGDIRVHRANKWNAAFSSFRMYSSDGTNSNITGKALASQLIDILGTFVPRSKMIIFNSFMFEPANNPAYRTGDLPDVTTFVWQVKFSKQSDSQNENSLAQRFSVTLQPPGPAIQNTKLVFSLRYIRSPVLCMLYVTSDFESEPEVTDQIDLSTELQPNASMVFHLFAFKVSFIPLVNSTNSSTTRPLVNILVDVSLRETDNTLNYFKNMTATFKPLQLPFSLTKELDVVVTHYISDTTTPQLYAYLDYLGLQMGGMDLTASRLDMSWNGFSTDNCIVATVVVSMTNDPIAYCQECRYGFLIDMYSGKCYYPTAGRNATCVSFYDPNSCYVCNPSLYYYSLTETSCIPKSGGCLSSTHSVASYMGPGNVDRCSDDRFYDANSGCWFFAQFSGGVCKCKVQNCLKCKYTECDLCSGGYLLLVYGKFRSCVATAANLQDYGKVVGAAVPQVQPCLLKGRSCWLNYRKMYNCPSGTTNDPGKGDLCFICKPELSRFWTLASNTSDSTCLGCSVACSACIETDDKCLSCRLEGSKKYFLVENSSCLACTPNDTYNLSATDQRYLYQDNSNTSRPLCKLCDSACMLCSGPLNNQCTSCRSKFFLFSDNTCQPCDTTAGRYVSGFTCLNCDLACTTCSGPSEHDCTSCANSLHLDSHRTCVNCNREGYFTITDDPRCFQCSANCKECALQANNCTSCTSGLYLDLATRVCMQCNESGKYRNNTDHTCRLCYQDCLTCSGPLAEDCLTCQMLEGKYLQENSTCGVCDIGNTYFVSSSGVCSACTENCQVCDGSAKTQCKSCIPPYKLNDGSCEIKELRVLSSGFDRYTKSVRWVMSEDVVSTGDINGVAGAGLFQKPRIDIQEIIEGLKFGTDLSKIIELQPVNRGSCKKISISGRIIELFLDLPTPIDLQDSVAVLNFKRFGSLYAKSDASTVYSNPNLIVQNITFESTELEAALNSAVSSVSILVTIFALPQIFILLRLFNSLDLYVFIDVVYPTLFEKVLEMFSVSIGDIFPNIFESLADDEGEEVHPRLKHFGFEVHFLKNLGPLFTLTLCAFAIRLLTLPFSKTSPTSGAFKRSLCWTHLFFDGEFWVGLVESSHIEILFSIFLFLASREKVDEWQPKRYFMVCIVSLLSLSLVFLYGYLIYTIARLVRAYYRHAVLEIEDMADEPLRFLLADKRVDGSWFEVYFSIVLIIRELLMCVVVYFLINRPKIVTVTLCLAQLVFTIGVLTSAPYTTKRANLSLRINNVLYLMLNIALLYLAFADIATARKSKLYYGVGISMIGILAGLVFSNIGFTLYYTAVEWYKKWKAWRTKQAAPKQTHEEQEESNANMAGEDDELRTQNKVGGKVATSNSYQPINNSISILDPVISDSSTLNQKSSSEEPERPPKKPLISALQKPQKIVVKPVKKNTITQRPSKTTISLSNSIKTTTTASKKP